MRDDPIPVPTVRQPADAVSRNRGRYDPCSAGSVPTGARVEVADHVRTELTARERMWHACAARIVAAAPGCSRRGLLLRAYLPASRELFPDLDPWVRAQALACDVPTLPPDQELRPAVQHGLIEEVTRLEAAWAWATARGIALTAMEIGTSACALVRAMRLRLAALRGGLLQ